MNTAVAHRYLVKDPRYVTIGRLFHDGGLFEVPKYQRAFAWESDHVGDFLQDIGKCYHCRSNNGAREHFFGGIVCVETEVAGTGFVTREIVDGQQRVATFSMVASQLIARCEALANQGGEAAISDSDIVGLCKDRASRLRLQFLEQKGERNRKPVDLPRVTLSAADRLFFSKLIIGEPSEPRRNSHELLLKAYKLIGKFLDDLLQPLAPIAQVDAIGHLISVLNDDCSFIYIPSTRRSDAYRLFQVLNDRGETLSAGDLLRAATLERLEGDTFSQQQCDAEELWDEILADPPQRVEEYLQWYFAAHKGKRPRAASLFDDFMEAFFDFPQALTNTSAKQLISVIRDLRNSIATMQKLVAGEWPYHHQQPITAWNRARLHCLVQELGHTHCMPLLFAATKLKHTMFSDIIGVVERFVFRYKIVCNQHIGPASSIYFAHAKAIIENPARYRIGPLIASLKQLLNDRATEDLFQKILTEFKYSPHGSNANVKYLLIMLEDHWRWYRNGAQGKPKCLEQSRIFDFANTTIEHIYPQSVPERSRQASMERLKHNLGNLTILGPSDNDKVGNYEFERKKVAFQDTHVSMNLEVAEAVKWTSTEISKRAKDMIFAAKKIFSSPVV